MTCECLCLCDSDVHVCVCVCAYVCVRTYVCLCVCACVYACLCESVHARVHETVGMLKYVLECFFFSPVCNFKESLGLFQTCFLLKPLYVFPLQLICLKRIHNTSNDLDNTYCLKQ